MRIYLHIGLEHAGAAPLQHALAAKRKQLEREGILFPKILGDKKHTRLFLAMTDPDHIDPLRHNRGFGDPVKQAELATRLQTELLAEFADKTPKSMILSCAELASGMIRKTELDRLRSFLSVFPDDIRIVAHVDEQGRMLARHYAEQIAQGRTSPLSLEADMAGSETWWDDCLAKWAPRIPTQRGFPEIQAPPHWLDYQALVSKWEAVFGKGAVTLRSYDEVLFQSADIVKELVAAFDIPQSIGRTDAYVTPIPASAASLTRGRLMNETLVKVVQAGHVVPPNLWKSIVNDVAIPGAPLVAGSLSDVSKGFEGQNKALQKTHPVLGAATLKRDRATKAWQEAAPEQGYRTTQYLAVFKDRIDDATTDAKKAKKGGAKPKKAKSAKTPTTIDLGLSDFAKDKMPPLAKENYAKLKSSPFAPHNQMGSVNEEALAAAYTPAPTRTLPKAAKGGNSGNVISVFSSTRLISQNLTFRYGPPHHCTMGRFAEFSQNSAI